MDEKCPKCKRWTYGFYYVYELKLCDDCAKKAGYKLHYHETYVSAEVSQRRGKVNESKRAKK
jgi:hypothetical protein